MIRYFKNKKHLKILVIIGLLFPATDHANQLILELCKKYVIDVITKKIGEKALEYMAGSAVMAGLVAHLKVPHADSFIKSDLDYVHELTQDTKQALTPAVKKVAKKVSIAVASQAAKEVIQKKVVLPAPVNVSSQIPRNSPSPRRSAHSCTLIGSPTPTVTFAVANTQNIVCKKTSDTPIASSSTLTRTAFKQVVINKASQNSATSPLVKQVVQIPSPSHAVTHTFKQSSSNFNARTQHSNTPPTFTVRAEAIPIDRTYQDDGKSIIRQAELAQQIQRFISNNKPFLDELQQKLNTATQQSIKPHIIKRQLELAGYSIPQYDLNAELTVKKGMILEHIFNRNGEFQGCYSQDKQTQLEEYAKGNLFTFNYSTKRMWSWLKNKIKNFGSSQALAEQIRTNPYNLNLYNFVIQFESKNFEGAAHYLNLIRPDSLLETSPRGVIYKNMYDSFINQFSNITDLSTLADKMSVVCKDHSNPVIREIFNQFFNENTIFKKYVSAYIKNYQDIHIPQEIATQKFTELRTLYLKLVTMHPSNQEKVQQIRQGLLYIKEACSGNQHASLFNKLAQLIHKQVTSTNNSIILYCRNFAQSFSSLEAQQIQQEVLPFINKAVELWQSIPENSLDEPAQLSKQCAQEILANANILYDALAHGDLPKARFIKEHILPTLTPEYIKTHGNTLEALVAPTKISSPSFSLPQQLLTAKLVASVPSIPSSINSPCSVTEDKSKNLQQIPNQCMPEIKIPVPECQMPNQAPPIIKSCEVPRFESEAERRVNAEIEASQNKPESSEESQGRQCNWSNGSNFPSFKEEKVISSPEPPHNDKNPEEKAKNLVEQIKQKLAAKEFKENTLLDSENENLIKKFKPEDYNPAIINLDSLIKALEKFKNTIGAMGENGPLRQILINGKLNSDCKSSLKGAAYELEKALELEKQGKKIIEFGKKIEGREFDIVTEHELIECKNIDWDRFVKTGDEVKDKKIDDLTHKTRSIFVHQKQLSETRNLNFEIHSKNKIPTNWKQWFTEKKITFFEG